MSQAIKMNVLLAKADHAQAVYNKAIVDQVRIFKNNQGMFKGIKKTYEPREGYTAEDKYIADTKVGSTVKEQFDWLTKTINNFWNLQFAEEATNSAGAPKVELVYDGISFGEVTALDLMRLKSLLSSREFKALLESIPVREDNKVWNPTHNVIYKDREVYETPLISGVSKTTEKEEVILKDPNLDPSHLPNNYNAKTTIRSKVVEIGDYTIQNFSGEWTQEQKAKALRRLSGLYGAVVSALKEVNDMETLPPNVHVESLTSYIFG